MSWGKASASCNITTSWSGPTSERDVRERRDPKFDVRGSKFQKPRTSDLEPSRLARPARLASSFKERGFYQMAENSCNRPFGTSHPLPLAGAPWVRCLDSLCRWVYQDAMARGTRRAGRRAIAAVI